MSNQGNSKGNPNSGKCLQPQDFKKLVQNQGKANCFGQECVLKSPTHNDPQLREIACDPSCTVKQIGAPSQNYCGTYELCARGKSIKVTVA